MFIVLNCGDDGVTDNSHGVFLRKFPYFPGPCLFPQSIFPRVTHTMVRFRPMASFSFVRLPNDYLRHFLLDLCTHTLTCPVERIHRIIFFRWRTGSIARWTIYTSTMYVIISWIFVYRIRWITSFTTKVDGGRQTIE